MNFAVETFRPPDWLRNPHVQTIVGRALRTRCAFSYERRRLETPDGDFLDVDGAAPGTELLPAAPTCIVLHGLQGSSASGCHSISRPAPTVSRSAWAGYTTARGRARGQPALETAISHFGGHLGYVARDPQLRLWAEARAVDWLARRLHDLPGGNQR